MGGPADDAWSLDGRVAVVTGAGRGLGAACAEELARRGAALVIVARGAAELEREAERLRAEGAQVEVVAADVTDEGGARLVLAAAERLGDLRVCVNSAGTNRTGPSATYALDDWDALFAVNVRATFLMCREVGGSLLRRGLPGSIVNMSSQMGSVGYPGRAAYCAGKHAVEGMTKALAVEWAAAGVRVNAVAPTFVETPMTRPMLADEEFHKEVLGRIPSGRLATCEEVAAAVAFLACDGSNSVTGHSLKVDGGWTAW
ncbi:MAG: SDR family NAD(P)-dependent oxidoreductase [Solirubrobacterales bacterium]